MAERMLGSRGSKDFEDAHKDLFLNGRMLTEVKRYLLTPSFSSIIINMCVSPIVCMLLTEMRKFGDLGVLQELITGCLLRYTHVILLQGLSRAMYGEDNV